MDNETYCPSFIFPEFHYQWKWVNFPSITLQRSKQYLSGGESSIIVLLGRQPPNNPCSITQILGSVGGREFSQQHIGAYLHRQRGRCFCCCLRPVGETTWKQPSTNNGTENDPLSSNTQSQYKWLTIFSGHWVEVLQEVSSGLHVSCQSEDVRQQSCSVDVAEIIDGLSEARQASFHHSVLWQNKTTENDIYGKYDCTSLNKNSPCSKWLKVSNFDLFALRFVCASWALVVLLSAVPLTLTAMFCTAEG